MEREGVISLGEAVMVPEGRNVVFVKEVFDGEVAVEARVRYRDGNIAVELTRKTKAKRNGMLKSIAIV